MAKPKPYSNTDTAEQRALTVLQQLLNPRFVKDDIRTRDKVPNVDGTIELVNEEQIPYGKFDVQLRTIAAGKKKYSCPSSLVKYSEVSTTLPVLLICVDPDHNRAFWKHIHSTMPEYKEDQQTFTVRFDTSANAIDKSDLYLHRWSEIVCDYQKRITDYPSLRKEVAQKLELTGLSQGDKFAFQRFVHTVNNLLDHDFICIKRYFFPGTWQLGVAVSASESDSVLYQVYKIRDGEPAPPIREAEGTLFGRQWTSTDLFYQTTIDRERLSNPEALGRAFVLEYVNRGLEQRVLSIHGVLLASEVLIHFVDRYPALLGLPPGKDSYRLSELSYALNDHMYRICAALARDKQKDGEQLPVLRVDEVSSLLRTRPVQPMRPGEASVPFLVRSDQPPMRLVLDAFDYLVAHKVALVERVFAQRSELGNGWVWSGWSEEDEIRSVTRVLAASVDEYSAFVTGNHLQLPRSLFLDESTAIVYEYHPIKYQRSPWSGPGIKIYFLENYDHSLPKVSVRVRMEDREIIDGTGFLNIIIDGKAFRATQLTEGAADFLFHDLPVLNIVYRMLSKDLREHYQMDITHQL